VAVDKIIRYALIRRDTFERFLQDAASALDGPMAWGQVVGAWGRAKGDANAASLDRNLGGFMLGVDAPLSTATELSAIVALQNSRAERVRKGCGDQPA
jgi:outer membrane autotransporter protein